MWQFDSASQGNNPAKAGSPSYLVS